MPLNMWKFLSLTSLFLILLESILSFWLQNTMSGDSPHKSQREGYCRICKHLGLPSHPHVCIIEHGLWLLRWLEYKCVHELAMACVSQGAKKIIFTAYLSGKLKLAFTSPDVISKLISQFLCYSNSSKNITCQSGKLKTEFTSPIAKSTSPGLSDTTLFARWVSAFILVKSEPSLVKSIKTFQIFGTILLNFLVLYMYKPSLMSTSKFVHNISLTGDMLHSITWLLKKTESFEKRIGKGQVTLKTEK